MAATEPFEAMTSADGHRYDGTASAALRVPYGGSTGRALAAVRTTSVERPPMASRAKRAMDIVGALVLLVVTVPLMLAVTVAVKLSSPGPVMFRQRRVGALGREFTLLKFRSMRADAEDVLRADPEMYAEYLRHDHKLPPEMDPRITRVGRFIRVTSIDELPQMWNVLKGDMSLVGPRPVLREEVARYGSAANEVLLARPGLTGAWQVAGRSMVNYESRTELDRQYVRTWSLLGDLCIMLKTVPAVLRRHGAH